MQKTDQNALNLILKAQKTTLFVLTEFAISSDLIIVQLQN